MLSSRTRPVFGPRLRSFLAATAATAAFPRRRPPPPVIPCREHGCQAAAHKIKVRLSSSDSLLLALHHLFGQRHAVFPLANALDTSTLPTATFHATVRPAAILHAPAPAIPAGNITDRRHHMHHLCGRRPGVERGSGGGAVAVNGRVRRRCRQAVAVAGGRVYSCRLLMAHKHHSYVIINFASFSWRRRRAARLRQQYRRGDRWTYLPIPQKTVKPGR